MTQQSQPAASRLPRSSGEQCWPLLCFHFYSPPSTLTTRPPKIISSYSREETLPWQDVQMQVLRGAALSLA